MTTLEIEFKTLLTKETYDRLLSFFDSPPVQQTNHYIDTPDFKLREQQMALRVRTFQNGAELTLKTRQPIGHLEYTYALSPEETSACLNHIRLPNCPAKSLLEKQGIFSDDLHLLGHLTTLRHEKKMPFGLLALDRNSYGRVIDYELEVEVSDADSDKAAFLDFLKQEKIPYQPAKSKIARFCDALL